MHKVDITFYKICWICSFLKHIISPSSHCWIMMLTSLPEFLPTSFKLLKCKGKLIERSLYTPVLRMLQIWNCIFTLNKISLLLKKFLFPLFLKLYKYTYIHPFSKNCLIWNYIWNIYTFSFLVKRVMHYACIFDIKGKIPFCFSDSLQSLYIPLEKLSL